MAGSTRMRAHPHHYHHHSAPNTRAQGEEDGWGEVGTTDYEKNRTAPEGMEWRKWE